MIIKTFKQFFKSKQIKKVKFLKPKEWKPTEDQDQDENKDQQD